MSLMVPALDDVVGAGRASVWVFPVSFERRALTCPPDVAPVKPLTVTAMAPVVTAAPTVKATRAVAPICTTTPVAGFGVLADTLKPDGGVYVTLYVPAGTVALPVPDVEIAIDAVPGASVRCAIAIPPEAVPGKPLTVI
jgi:hypothetical protein